MAKTKPVATSNGAVYGYAVQCPGCGHWHCFSTNAGPGKPNWTFNGDLDKPTFYPSMLTWTGESPSGERLNVCHSFVRDGNIEFLSDCTKHGLRGVHPLPDID